MKFSARLMLALVTCHLSLVTCHADLTAIVTPGYQFPTDGSVAPSFDLLNLLGNPTIQIYGTVGGSNTLAAGSITGTQLASSVADGATIGFNGNTPPGLRVLAGGIIGPGLKAVTTTNLQVWVDTNYFQLATNTIANTNDNSVTQWITFQPLCLTDTNINAAAGIQWSKLAQSVGTNAPLTNSLLVIGPDGQITNALPSYNFQLASLPNTNNSQTNYSLGLRYFQSDLLTLPAAGGVVTSNLAHGLTLTNAPRLVRWTLVCITNNCGYVVGDEIGLESARDGAGAMPFSSGASSTNVFMAKRAAITGVLNKITGASDSSFTELDWKARCYAAP